MAQLSDKEFAKAALNAGLVKPDMVKECTAIQKRIVKMGRLPENLKDLLVEKGYIAEDVARRIARGDKPEEAKKKEKVVRIGGYEVMSRLGKGQMGSVYKARQLSLDRVVALKVLPSRLAGDKRYLDRFLREAKAAGRLNHPNIVTAVDFGESDGLYYYAMDYIEGVNVGAILEEEGKLGEDEALAIALQIAKALEHAHKHNIIHRDIKPENIMLDMEGMARLCDLGLAREANEDGALTQVGIVLGTPYYVSPEQAQGRRDLDIRSDIYSLGITLFHMVTGEVPFKGPTGPAIMVKHINDEMPDPRKFNPNLSNGTAQLIRKMTAKKRERRYQTPADMIKDMERVIAGERPAAAGQVIRARRPRRPGRAREEVLYEPARGGGRKLIGLVAIGAIILIIIVVVSSLPESEPRRRSRPVGGHTAGRSDAVTPPRDRDSGRQRPPTARERPKPAGRLSSDQREIMEIVKWARTHRNETAEAARRYRKFIEAATDPKALRTAKNALEGLASREYLTLVSRFKSLLAIGKVVEALGETTEYMKLFGDTESARKVAALVDEVKKERRKGIDVSIAKAVGLADEKKFKEALDLIAEMADMAPQGLKPRVASVRKKIEKARDGFIAGRREKARSTRAEFEKKLSERIANLHLGEAVALINQRTEVETEASIVETLRTKASDLMEARQALNLVMANLKYLSGLRQSFKISGKGTSTGMIGKVGADSFVFNMGAVVREVKLNELSSEDIVRLAEHSIGPEEAATRFRLGLLLLLVLGDPQAARAQFVRAGELGIDTSRFERMLTATQVEELIFEAQKKEKRKKFLQAAFAYSSVLSAIADNDSYAVRRKEIEGKIEHCLNESGVQNVFHGKVSIKNGRLVVFYDFSHPAQWQDFKGYVWSEKLKRPIEWIVEKGVLVGKGTEGVIWKGKFSGDVVVEVEATPKRPRKSTFFMRLCDDGKGWKGKNYSFGFGSKQKVPVGRRGKRIIYREGPQENLIAKWRGSTKKYTYLKRGIGFPQIAPGKTYKVRVERTGNTLRAIVNGTTIAQVEGKDYKKGGVSLKVVDSTVHFDNLRITGDFDQTWLNREIRKAK